jgi:glycosyltransferase involved in cell wall biosynthesis
MEYRKYSDSTARFNTSLLDVSQGGVKSQRQRTKHLKVSVLTEFFPPDYAATGQLLSELIRYLSLQGIDFKVFTGQPGYAYSENNAARYEVSGTLQIRRSRVSSIWSHRIRGKALNGLTFVLRSVLHLLRNCRGHNLVILTTAPPFLTILGYLNYLVFKIPYVCILYDLYPDIAVALGAVSEQHFAVRFWQKLNLKIWRHSAGIVVLSDAMKQRILSYCPEIADRLTVIHSWSNPEQVIPIPKHENWFAWRHGLVKPFTVAYSGNMGRCHDMDTIVKAAILLKDKPIQFVFIGAGAKRQEIIHQVEKFDLKNCKFLPYQDKEILPYSLTACDLSLVSVDQGMESLVAPSKLYPALATGRPIAVVCPPNSYLKQLVDEAQCGAAFANNDAQSLADFIELLSQDANLAVRMGQAGRRYAIEHFTLDEIAQQYLSVFQQAIYQAT